MRWWSICGDVDIASEPRSVFFFVVAFVFAGVVTLTEFYCLLNPKQSKMRKSKSFTSFACGDTFQTEIRSQENRTFCERRFIRCSARCQQCQLLNSNLKRQDENAFRTCAQEMLDSASCTASCYSTRKLNNYCSTINASVRCVRI